MSISNPFELTGMQHVSNVVAQTLKAMREAARPGMSTLELDLLGGELLKKAGAQSAPYVTYKFPGYTCISVNHEIAHGIPSKKTILREGDLVNIDVSAELGGFFADNGGSFVLGKDLKRHQQLVDASQKILLGAIRRIHHGVRIAEVGGWIEQQARRSGFRVIRNLTGHGVGRGLHEWPEEIPNFFDRRNKDVFCRNSVVAIETFISTRSDFAETGDDGWTLTGDRGGFVAQHEHTILVTDGKPVLLTAENGIV